MTQPVIAKTKHGMSVGEGVMWWIMICATGGIAYPVYRMRKHAVDRTQTTYYYGQQR